VIIPVHNGAHAIGAKIAACLTLDYPHERLRVVVASDGSTDATVSTARATAAFDHRVEVLEIREHVGKNAALTRAISRCNDDMIVVTDVDAALEPSSVRVAGEWLTNPSIGGVCGRKVIRSEGTGFDESQVGYNAYQEVIKRCESRLHSTAMNEGKLHAMRRELFRPIPIGCMDDLYNLLSVVRGGKRFIYEPQARTHIRAPSCSPGHELERRRRIVNGSLKALWCNRKLLNPLVNPFYAWMLWSQKVFRRLAPLFMLAFLAQSVLLATRGMSWAALAVVQGGVFTVALLVHIGALPGKRSRGRFARLLALPYYFCLGNWGTLCGVSDFCTGSHNADRWTTPQRPQVIPQVAPRDGT